MLGLGFSLMFLLPALQLLRAGSWVVTECELLASGVASHPDPDQSTYAIKLRYRYVWNGRTYEGSRYGFLSGYSTQYAAKREIVDRLRTSRTVECYLDPEAPGSSVLHRGFTGDYAFGLVPLIFVAVGAGGLLRTLRRHKLGLDSAES